MDAGFFSVRKGCGDGNLNYSRENASEIIPQIVQNAVENGEANIHLIGHSMGGVDGRVLAYDLGKKEKLIQVSVMDGNPVYQRLKIESLTTHGTPHAGTPLADASFAQNIIVDMCDLNETAMASANEWLLPYNTKVATIGSDADADANGDGEISGAEQTNNQIPTDMLSTAAYQYLYTGTAELGYTYVIGFGFFPKIEYGSESNLNDTIVTVSSSSGAPGVYRTTSMQGKNHGTIIDNAAQNSAISTGKSSLGWGEL